jgi:hypothetical protein
LVRGGDARHRDLLLVDIHMSTWQGMLTTKQEAVIKKILGDTHFQNIIGGGEWSLTDDEESELWNIIRLLAPESMRPEPKIIGKRSVRDLMNDLNPGRGDG